MLSKNISCLLFFFLPFFLVPHVSAQYRFQRTYNGLNFISGLQTSDGGYIAGGITKKYGAGNDDIFLLKVNPIGETEWFKTYGSIGKDVASSVIQTFDGGYIIVGTTYGFGLPVDIFLVKTDAGGDTLWTRTYGTGDVENGWSIQQTADSGYIICGQTRPTTANTDVYLLKTDVSGNVEWVKIYGGPKEDVAYSIILTKNGNYALVGGTSSYGPSPDANLYVMKLDSAGDTLWCSAYSCKLNEWGQQILQTPDEGFIIMSQVFDFGAGRFDYYLVKLDSGGELMWAKAYGTALDDFGIAISLAYDGGYILAGGSRSFVGSTGQYDIYLIRTDSDGDTLWTKLFGRDTEDDMAASVHETNDSGLVIFAGSYNPNYFNDYFSYLIKTDKNGDTECNTRFVNTIVTNAPTTRFEAPGVIGSTGSEKNVAPIIKDAFPADSLLCVECATVSISLDENICLGEKSHITVNTTVISSFLWSPSDGLSCTDCPDPVASPDSSMYYYLKVTDINGCESADSIYINVDSCIVDLSVPNIFSPNGDGINDQWVIKGVGAKGWNLQIFNRWGELLYYTDMPSEKHWSGMTFSGREVPAGIYYYVIDNQYLRIYNRGYLHLMR